MKMKITETQAHSQPLITIFDLFLAHLSRRLEWAIVIATVRRPSVRRPSSVRPSVNFSHFRLLLQNHWKDFDETW